MRYAIVCIGSYLVATIATGIWTTAINRSLSEVSYAPAVDAALAIPGDHRAYCEDFAWCSLIVGQPHFRVWWDGRADPYPMHVWREARHVAADRPRGAALKYLDEYDVDVAIARAQAPLTAVLAKAKWDLVASESGYTVWLRPSMVRVSQR
jgi:hypothetical protein